jgi:pimeloyl-ACP methyl ester carboxylesterase
LQFAQFSALPWRIAPQVALDEMRSFAASPAFDELLYNLAYGEEPEGAPAGAIEHPLVIGWGRRDRVCLPSQSKLALEKFPGARLHWFERCGHFPQWDRPQETVRLILNSTGREKIAETTRVTEKMVGSNPGEFILELP